MFNFYTNDSLANISVKDLLLERRARLSGIPYSVVSIRRIFTMNYGVTWKGENYRTIAAYKDHFMLDQINFNDEPENNWYTCECQLIIVYQWEQLLS
jgi:hypothetical protein